MSEANGVIDYPKSFKDLAGRDWTVTIPFGTYKRLKAELSLSIEDLVFIEGEGNKRRYSTQPLADLFSDIDKFMTVLAAILKPAMEQAGVARDQFEAAMDGETITAAAQAFVTAVHDFFPKGHPKKMVLQDAAKKGKVAKETVTKRMAEMETADEQAFVKSLNRQLDDLLRSASTDQQLSLAVSIPTPTPTAS